MDPALHLCSLKAVQKSGGGEREKERWERKRESGGEEGLQKSLEGRSQTSRSKSDGVEAGLWNEKLSLGILPWEDFREGKLSQGTNSK